MINENIKEACEFLNAANGDKELALMAIILHCSKKISSSAAIDNNSAVRSFIYDAAANIGDIRDSIDNLKKSIDKIGE